MILWEITQTEDHPVYQELQVSNVNRQYDFLHSLVDAATAVDRKYLSEHVIKALNFHAITCLHTNAGEYRPCPVTVGAYQPPEHFRVDALMEDFVNVVNRVWVETDPVVLGAFVLWRLNYIHPFINGNGRTARAACYYVICMHSGKLLPGKAILPELITREREAYVKALQAADASFHAGSLDLTQLHALISDLLKEQIGADHGAGEAHPAAAELQGEELN